MIDRQVYLLLDQKGLQQDHIRLLLDQIYLLYNLNSLL